MNCHRLICGSTPRALTRLCLLSLLLFLPFATGGRAAATASPAKPTAEETAKAAAAAESAKPAGDKALTLDKVEVVTNLLAGTGETLLLREEIVRHSGADGDLNRLFLTQAHVQFSDNEGRVNVASILDLRPSLISIAGGRPYDNTFTIDGLATNSLQDSSNRTFMPPTMSSAIRRPRC